MSEATELLNVWRKHIASVWEHRGRETVYTSNEVMHTCHGCGGCSANILEGLCEGCRESLAAALTDETVKANPCSKIFDFKWLNPECVESGCRSLVLKHRVEELEKLLERAQLHLGDHAFHARYKLQEEIATVLGDRPLDFTQLGPGAE